MAHGDKRSVSTDALETLGTIIGDGAGRDAIHLAVEPVVAAEDLMVGQHVGFKDGGVGSCAKSLGIVDPFLMEGPRKGEHFWMVVYPRQITSLRHVWSHPEFPEETVDANKIAISKEFIDEAASRIGVSPAELMSSVEWYLNSRDRGDESDVICFGEEIDSREMPEGFWAHYEAFTGRKVPEEFRAVHFRCAC